MISFSGSGCDDYSLSEKNASSPSLDLVCTSICSGLHDSVNCAELLLPVAICSIEFIPFKRMVASLQNQNSSGIPGT